MLKGLTQTKIPRNTRFDDHLSMSFSNEQRVPLLDHRLSEFVSTIPPNFLFNDGRPKSILRDSMRGLVPDEVLFAKKREVQSPQREWLGKPLQTFVSGVLSSESFADRGFINVEKAKKYYENYLKETPANSFALWQWINLEMWHRMFIDSSLDNIMQQPQLVLGEQGFNVN
jgi:asparagine synthase (glutamine-hydrolysing)